jgi:competence protein ComEC
MRHFQWPLLLVTSLLILLGIRVHQRYWGNFTLTFLDVGQGDAALIQFQGGKTLLIDSGGIFGRSNFGQRTLYPELARKGILQLDYAVLSHPDRDHGHGFLGLFDSMTISEFWYPEVFKRQKHPLLMELLNRAKTRSKSKGFEQFSKQSLGGANIELFPMRHLGPKSNNNSMVALLTYHGCRFLFTGDIEKPAEEQLSKVRLPNITVLKVPHHGSHTSSSVSLLNSLRPRIAVISAGRGNPYHHPHLSVLRRYRQWGSQVLRTDFHGFVEFTVDREGKMTCRSYEGYCGTIQCPSETF